MISMTIMYFKGNVHTVYASSTSVGANRLPCLCTARTEKQGDKFIATVFVSDMCFVMDSDNDDDDDKQKTNVV
jgi:hypothetical protein